MTLPRGFLANSGQEGPDRQESGTVRSAIRRSGSEDARTHANRERRRATLGGTAYDGVDRALSQPIDAHVRAGGKARPWRLYWSGPRDCTATRVCAPKAKSAVVILEQIMQRA